MLASVHSAGENHAIRRCIPVYECLRALRARETLVTCQTQTYVLFPVSFLSAIYAVVIKPPDVNIKMVFMNG